jgi:hypothetical protein
MADGREIRHLFFKIFRACFQNPFEAAEQRTMVAHGETVGFQSQTVQAPEWGERTVLTAVGV